MISDLKTIYQLIKPIHGDSHAQRMEYFYELQSDHYDKFRKRLLVGRKHLFRQANDAQPKGVWVDFGAGTGSNLDFLSDEQLQAYDKIFLVDLAGSLLTKAEEKIATRGLQNVEIVNQSAHEFNPGCPVNLVSFSYSLTMIPQWYQVLDHAEFLLSENGKIAVIDFYISEKFPMTGLKHHNRFTRHFWPFWFSHDNVFLSSDHLPYLLNKFDKIRLFEGQNAVPYLPVGQVPFYSYIGQKKA